MPKAAPKLPKRFNCVFPSRRSSRSSARHAAFTVAGFLAGKRNENTAQTPEDQQVPGVRMVCKLVHGNGPNGRYVLESRLFSSGAETK